MTATTGSTTTKFDWDVVSGGSLSRVIDDGTNAYVYGPSIFGGSAPVEQIALSTKIPAYLSTIPSGVQLVFKANGALVNRSTYSTYGAQTNSTGAASPFGFQGGYTDGTGLVYFLNRYYDPTTGQFISVDPRIGSTGQPYAFAGDNPINAGDPSGLQSSPAYSQAEVNMAFFIWIHGLDAWLNFVNSLPSSPPASSDNPFLWSLLAGLTNFYSNQSQAIATAQNDYMCGGPCLSPEQQAVNDYTSNETQFVMSPAQLAQVSAGAQQGGRVLDCVLEGAGAAGGGLELGFGDLVWTAANKAGVSISTGGADTAAGGVGFIYGCAHGIWPF